MKRGQRNILNRLKKISLSYYKKFIITYLIVLFIPIVIIEGANYFIIKKQLFVQLQKEVKLESETQLATLEVQSKTINSIVYDGQYDKIYSLLYRSDPPNTHFDIIRDLRKKEAVAPFFSNIFFYNSKENTAFGSGGKYNADYFLKNLIRTSKPVPFDSYESGKAYSVKIKDTLPNEYATALIVPIFMAENTSENAGRFLIFIITDKRILQLIRTTHIDESCEGILSYQGQPIYASSAEDNQLLYENKSIDHIFSLKDYFHYSYNDISGFSVHWALPKRLFDKMLLQFVLLQTGLILAVLILGLTAVYNFSNRNYKPLKSLMQKMRQDNADQIIQQDEFQYMDNVLTDLLYSKDVLQESNRELNHEKYLYYILNHPIHKEDKLYQRCLEEQIHLDKKQSFFVIFDDILENQSAYSFFETEIFKNEGSYAYSLYLFENKFIYLICTDAETSEIQLWLDNFKDDGTRLGIGQIVNDVSNLSLSYASAKLALHHIEHPTGGANYPFAELQSFREAVGIGSAECAEFLMQGILDQAKTSQEFVACGMYWDIIRILASDDQIDELLSTIKDIDHEKLEIAVRHFYNGFLESCEKSNTCENYKRKSIVEINQYINEHYRDKAFSIKYMAAEFGITASNLSHFFKKSTGQNISQYIDNIRLLKAKEMLLKENKKVIDVANYLGYNNVTAFIELFKKNVGMTPGAFRDNQTQ